MVEEQNQQTISTNAEPDGGVPGIIKTTHQEDSEKHAHFNEVEIAEYDKQRGQCMKIDDPKTPYHDEDLEEDS